MQSNTQNTDIDLVLEIRPWTFIQSRRSDIHYYYHAVENVPMMFDGFEKLPIKIAGKRLGMVIYSDSQRKDFKELTGVYMDESVLRLQLLMYSSKRNIYPFEVENEEILTNILRDIFAENLKNEDEYAQIQRLITSWFDQEKGWFEIKTNVSSVSSLNFIWFVEYERKIKLNELIDLEEILESRERVIILIGEFYAMENDKRLKSIKSISAPSQAVENEDGKIKLQHQEIALLHFYDELPLHSGIAQDIAEKYGQTSGNVLMRRYGKVNKSQTERRNHKNAKKYLETIIPLLTNFEGSERAKQDLANVKTRID